MLTVGANTPAVSQVPTSPGFGAASNTHRRHGVSPGMMVMLIPSLPTAPPYTHGLPSFTATSLMRYRTSELSLPSRTMSAPRHSSSMLVRSMSATTGSTVTDE